MNNLRHNPTQTAVLLGAGASRAEGAPLQGELFRDYFLYCIDRRENGGAHQWDAELSAFFHEFFGISVDDRDQIKAQPFPTFEEVLGIIEIGFTQKEEFFGWGTIATAPQKPRLDHLHDVLVLLIAEVLDHKLRDRAEHHRKLIANLASSDSLRNTTFVSFNYDILIDNAILPERESRQFDLDYAIEFSNFGDEWEQPDAVRSVKLFKLHGSLNWLYCPVCRAIRITPKEKGICRLKWRPEECACRTCGTTATPIIIPPTYFKALSNLYLRQVWHAAELALRNCDRLVICGYSFPDADVHVRYLLKRVEMMRDTPFQVAIVNEHKGKDDFARVLEKQRYVRFFRDASRVHYTDLSFEAFCKNPAALDLKLAAAE